MIIVVISQDLFSILHNGNKQNKHFRILINSACDIDRARPIIASTRAVEPIRSRETSVYF